jgi:pimeloyl-ACP methyl ester carboxylesterase
VDGRMVATRVGRVHVLEWTPRVGGEPGSASDLVFVHGLGGEARDWADVAGALPQRCVAIDLPGFGDSPPPTGSLDLPVLVAAVADVADALGLRDVHLVGNSLGGLVAVHVAVARPDVVARLSLLCPALPSWRLTRWSLSLLAVLVPRFGPRLMRRYSHGDPRRMAARVFAVCYGDPAAVPQRRRDAEIDLVTRRAAQPHADDVYRASLSAIVHSYVRRGRTAPWRLAAEVRVPVLVVYGGRDRLVGARGARRAARTFRTVRVELIPESGHLPHLEFPERVAALLAADPADAASARIGGGVRRPAPAVGMTRARGTVEADDIADRAGPHDMA